MLGRRVMFGAVVGAFLIPDAPGFRYASLIVFLVGWNFLRTASAIARKRTLSQVRYRCGRFK
jgi:hypothetical protein